MCTSDGSVFDVMLVNPIQLDTPFLLAQEENFQHTFHYSFLFVCFGFGYSSFVL